MIDVLVGLTHLFAKCSSFSSSSDVLIVGHIGIGKGVDYHTFLFSFVLLCVGNGWKGKAVKVKYQA